MNVAEALRLVPDVAFPPAGCSDISERAARYNARNGMEACRPR
ncbi:hypothetical protein [Streptomyces virginiae]